ncbi:hypothetical protein COLO4_11435 [Corchorus olitorius]|uniref:Protein kinase domain-containing protein n=1 Tax=Corchorus olitorius TaxID=93759 RepID=A0A1R3K4H1_9ROSI|nr:hypothetical protein COLO4_11435 [Corchorus olitorius]
MAVKSCDSGISASLKSEKQVLDQIGFCPQIIRCFGDGYSVEDGETLYNLFLEYADKGSLADHVKKNGGKLTESDVRRYARSILKGLRFLHAKGFVHCDIKLQNILLFGNGDVKIADFGLAKRNGDEEQRKMEIRGTPLNLAPESVNNNELGFNPINNFFPINIPGEFKTRFTVFQLHFIGFGSDSSIRL